MIKININNVTSNPNIAIGGALLNSLMALYFSKTSIISSMYVVTLEWMKISSSIYAYSTIHRFEINSHDSIPYSRNVHELVLCFENVSVIVIETIERTTSRCCCGWWVGPFCGLAGADCNWTDYSKALMDVMYVCIQYTARFSILISIWCMMAFVVISRERLMSSVDTIEWVEYSYLRVNTALKYKGYMYNSKLNVTWLTIENEHTKWVGTMK